MKHLKTYSIFEDKKLNDSFYQWFGDSKVVDRNGDPMIVHHRSNSKRSFNVFKEDQPIWFTPNESYANAFGGGGKKFSVYIKLENPIYVADIDGIANTKTIAYLSELTDIDVNTLKDILKETNGVNLFNITNSPRFKELVQSNGHDGIEAKEGRTTSYAVFASNQIKLTTNKEFTESPKINENTRIKTYLQLNESLTNTLYHFTRHESLGDILKDDMINLTLAIGTSTDYKINKSKFYFLSMQTTRNGGYGLRRELPVMLVMDGSKLNQSFKGGAVDYWQTSGNHNMKHNMDEFEERLVTDKQEIEMTKYVTEIHVWLNKLNDDEMYKIVGYSKKRADELGVPIYFYEDKTAYFNNVKSRAIDVDTEVEDPEKPLNRSGSSTDVLGVIAGGNEKTQEDLAGRIIFNKYKDNGKSKAEQTKGWVDFFQEFSDKWRLKYAEDWVKENPDSDKTSPYDFKIADMYSSVEAEIHNHRSSKDKFTKWIFSILIKDMKQLKAKSFKEYIEKKYGKFR